MCACFGTTEVGQLPPFSYDSGGESFVATSADRSGLPSQSVAWRTSRQVESGRRVPGNPAARSRYNLASALRNVVELMGRSKQARTTIQDDSLSWLVGSSLASLLFRESKLEGDSDPNRHRGVPRHGWSERPLCCSICGSLIQRI